MDAAQKPEFDSNAEFDRVAEELELEGVETEQEAANAEAEAETSALQAQEEQLQVATAMISQGLRFGIGAFSGVSVDDALYDQTARAYAELTAKYFPGGVLGLLDKYKEEITAVSVTLLLAGAVNKAKHEKAEAERKEKAEKAKQQKNDGTQNTAFDKKIV